MTSRVDAAVAWWDRHQVPLYLAAIGLGALAGLGTTAFASPLELAINPVLGLLLFATFLSVPIIRVARAFADFRFLGTVLVANFVAVPVVVFIITRPISGDQAVLVGVLLVLLTPCIDYVIVFTGLAGGARDRLLAAAPLLMLAQVALLPGYLWLFAGSEVLTVVDVAPFAHAFIVLILLPLTGAALVQFLARRHRIGRAIEQIMAALMVPLMILTLISVVGSQIGAVRNQLAALVTVLPIYLGFAVLAGLIGTAAGKWAGLDTAGRRAVVFSTVTRNSLVVLPLALALPPAMAIAPLVVVTQTLVELLVMVVMINLIPRMIVDRK